MNEFSVLMLAVLASSAAASCLLDKRIRGQWWVVDDNGDRIKDEAITVSSHNVDIVRGGHVTKYSCSHTSGYLVQLQPIGSEGYICLEFVPSDSGTHTEYSVIRRVHHTTGRMPVIQPTGLSQCSRAGDLGTVKVRRADPGCTFPSAIQGKWTFSGTFIKEISIENSTLAIQAFDFNAMELACERFQMKGNHTYMFALRKEHVTKNKDGCLCFRFHFVPMPEDDRDIRVLAGQRFSAGTPIKLIDHGAPIYLHQTCDYVDSFGTDTWHVALPQ
ncbi:uncharacterized protein LOC110454874 [Mizuhopecten yessoensis]|uniref:Uncharacterized protein n=1 Tax=Mizuhopecten yessoensis TaxID=6573 RepID=A0A210QEJ1_MIZYE|nr:uncharacterized protein LOC110454874 [Mizuhopecten yessoensis]XP_021360302.1 uncharacterized protein LOC110454874 [Mizuhopecten yessoensis]OWF47091.1 hypothetical protein KP79_PYT12578 [Mizuhopecten yessoensis]